jgi:hypothetical protein
MQQVHFQQKLVLGFIAVVLGTTLLAFKYKPGGDSYEIYLNNQLLLKQFVRQPLNLKSLSLDQSNAKDQLVVYYSHCGVTGKGRSLAVKDSKGTTLKKWNFANAREGARSGMIIPVKELLQLEKDHGSLSLYYTSEELPESRVLASFTVSDKNTVYQPTKESCPIWTAGSVLRITL